jgi:polar amino acid transport system substrate-binding protein
VASPTLEAIEGELIEPGSLTACLSVVGAPATALDEDGHLVGYNVSFAEEIASRLDLDLVTTEPLFDNLLDSVRDHECDLSISSQNITAGRLELVDFVAYTESIQPVLVASGNPEGINALTDLCGKSVSATEGTTHVDLVNGTGEYVGEGLNASCVAAGQPEIDLQTFQTESHAVSALLDGDVAAYLGNPNFAADFPDQIEYSDATLPPAKQGIATAKDRPALGAAVADAISAMIADGTYRAILIQHLPNDESVKIVSIVE